jgi:Uncharacterized protein conserved in bacteria
MSHVFKDKSRLLARIRRIRGQVEAIERTLDKENDCAEVMQLVASVRGAMNGLMAELIEGHVDHHVVAAPDDDSRRQGAKELLDILRTYMK